jgi:glutamyl-tRNA synthetase
MEQKKVVTRFAPSPTGLFHSGSYRTAIFSYLFAKKNGGEFILRIEDTDKERSKKEHEDNILESLSWLHLSYDKFYRQSENVQRHKEILQKLIAEDKAYISKEEAKDGSGVIKEIVRFRNPCRVVTFKDAVRGEISMDTTDLGDFVLAKNLEEPLFHLAVVVDDADEGVTHVIRGEDHISNTPRQILIYEALGFSVPIYAHLPLVLGEDRKKLSKRRGAQPLTFYREEGYLPSAMLNFIALIGFNDGTEKELFTLEELIEAFDLSKVQKGGAIFNSVKLDWINKEHIKNLSQEEKYESLIKYLTPHIFELPGFSKEALLKATPLLMERVSYFGEITALSRTGEFDYFFGAPKISHKEILFWKGSPDKESTAKRLSLLESLLKDIPSDSFSSAEEIKEKIWPLAEREGRGEILWPLRTALSGREKSADPFTLLSFLGKEESLKRLHTALSLCL